MACDRQGSQEAKRRRMKKKGKREKEKEREGRDAGGRKTAVF